MSEIDDLQETVRRLRRNIKAQYRRNRQKRIVHRDTFTVEEPKHETEYRDIPFEIIIRFDLKQTKASQQTIDTLEMLYQHEKGEYLNFKIMNPGWFIKRGILKKMVITGNYKLLR